MTLIGVVSDTHDNLEAARQAARRLVREGATIVLHLGDVIAPFTLKPFREEGVERLIAVYGNNCGEKLGLLRVARQLGYEIHEPPHLLEVDGKRILMLHGYGPAEKTLMIVEALAASNRFHAVLYGHTHRADNRFIGGTLLLNPGEACGYLTGKKTIALLDTEKMKAEIIEL